jgi:nucleotide sugar dehydrogenase
MQKPHIGQIGCGWIGRNYANDFERRGYQVTRYDLTDEFKDNKEKIKECDIVFIAVPTPSTPTGFDYSIVENVLPLVGEGKIAVIKSTILPGTTDALQEKFPNIHVMHSPEFLTEATAEYDVASPCRNIIGYTEKSKHKTSEVLIILPTAPYEVEVPAKEAEMIKYGGNCWFYFKVVYMNLLYDLCAKQGIDFETVKTAMAADKRIGRTHLDVVHKGGRGAGGHCFIKDMAAFSQMYGEQIGWENDTEGLILLTALQKKNAKLLMNSGKDLELLKGVYGEEKLSETKKDPCCGNGCCDDKKNV